MDGKTVTNRCGRDFLYYALHYHFPNKFNPQKLNPVKIDREKLFGLQLPSRLMWTQLQFLNLPKYLTSVGTTLYINGREITSFADFVSAIIFSRLTYTQALRKIEQAVNEGRAVGIDLGLKYGGLLDHVVFVYGYDQDVFYVCDTHQVPSLEYSKLTGDDTYFMKLPKVVAQKRWTLFGRVWELKKMGVS